MVMFLSIGAVMNILISFMAIAFAILAGTGFILLAVGFLSFLYFHFIEDPRVARIRSKNDSRKNGLTFEQSFQRLKTELANIDRDTNEKPVSKNTGFVGLKIFSPN